MPGDEVHLPHTCSRTTISPVRGLRYWVADNIDALTADQKLLKVSATNTAYACLRLLLPIPVNNFIMVIIEQRLEGRHAAQ
jgi:hypothetical protein